MLHKYSIPTDCKETINTHVQEVGKLSGGTSIKYKHMNNKLNLLLNILKSSSKHQFSKSNCQEKDYISEILSLILSNTPNKVNDVVVDRRII